MRKRKKPTGRPRCQYVRIGIWRIDVFVCVSELQSDKEDSTRTGWGEAVSADDTGMLGVVWCVCVCLPG